MRSVVVEAGWVTVSYPRAWDKEFAWRDLLRHPPVEVAHRIRRHVQLWKRAHTRAAWAWTARARVPG